MLLVNGFCVQIVGRPLNARRSYGSLHHTHTDHVPDVPEQSRSKCGTFDYLYHRPGGGDHQVFLMSFCFQVLLMS